MPHLQIVLDHCEEFELEHVYFLRLDTADLCKVCIVVEKVVVKLYGKHDADVCVCVLGGYQLEADSNTGEGRGGVYLVIKSR